MKSKHEMSSDHSHDGLGRPHLFHRPLTRRSFIGTVAAGTGVVLGSGLGLGAITLPRLGSTRAFAGGSADPRPLPGGVLHPPSGVFIHHFPPGSANEPSQISDFRGLVANSRVTGSGIGVDMNTGAETPLTFQVDMGIMDGLYIGQDDRRHRGAFAFI